jgi:hypothetical protein
MSDAILRGKATFPIIGILSCLLSGLLAAAQTKEFKLPAGCKLPFDAIATKT